jgi:hypothetical protein
LGSVLLMILILGGGVIGILLLLGRCEDGDTARRATRDAARIDCPGSGCVDAGAPRP